MKRNPETYLFDILEACNDIREFVRDIHFEDYSKSKITVAAVERKFSIIGEALARLRERYPELAEQISDIHQIVGFRNILIHGYHVVDSSVVWSAVVDKLPILSREVQRLIDARTALI